MYRDDDPYLTELREENRNPGQLFNPQLFWRWPRGGLRRRTLDQILPVYSQEVVEHDALVAPGENPGFRGVRICT